MTHPPNPSFLFDQPTHKMKLISELWNTAAQKQDRDLVPRDYIYASEIGGPMIDRFLKMKAEPYTNPPNDRSRRKFLSGDIWQYVVKQVLLTCGIAHEEEITANCKIEGCLSVHGRIDFKIEGKADVADFSHLPEFMQIVGTSIAEGLMGREFPASIAEIKSISSFGFEGLERTGAYPRHKGQTYHYSHCLNLPATLFYVCKDDCRMREYEVGPECEADYLSDLIAFTMIWESGQRPAPEPLIKLEASRFSKNLGVEYSPYLKLVYGFETTEAYRESVKYVEKWNRVVNRFAQVKAGVLTPKGNAIKITDANNEVRDEIQKAGFDFDGIVTVKCQLHDIQPEE